VFEKPKAQFPVHGVEATDHGMRELLFDQLHWARIHPLGAVTVIKLSPASPSNSVESSVRPVT
jgi:hypothetical protein